MDCTEQSFPGITNRMRRTLSIGDCLDFGSVDTNEVEGITIESVKTRAKLSHSIESRTTGDKSAHPKARHVTGHRCLT